MAILPPSQVMAHLLAARTKLPQPLTVGGSAAIDAAFASVSAPLGGSAPADTGLISSVEIMGNLIDLAAATSPILATNDPILLPTNGWVLKVVMADATVPLDFTKVTVTMQKQGFSNGVATTRTYTALGTGQLRRAWSSGGNHNTVLPAGTNAFYITLDEQIHAPDTITSIVFAAGFYSGSPSITINSGIVRNDNRPYPKPKVRFVTPPLQVMDSGGTLDVEITGTHRFAQGKRQWDKVEAWARVGGTDGAVASTQTMGRSAYTPSSGRLPSGIPAASFKVTVSGAGLSDGAGGIRVRVYPFVGDVWESWVEGTAWPSANVEQELPFIRDYAGKYSPVYAWVNQDGVAGGSPAVQTTATDPGSAASYATMGAAQAAISTYNNARGGGLAHNDPDGGFIMLRDVAGSTRGSNTGGYSVRATTTGGTLVPLRVKAASGVTSQLCRLRGELPDGSAPSSRVINRRVEFINIMFDSEGVSSNTNNIVFDGSSGQVTTGVANVLSIVTLVDCDIFERVGSGSSNNAIWRVGFRSDIRVEQQNVTGAAGITGQGYTGNWQCTPRMVGSYYHSDAMGVTLVPVFMAGCKLKNHGIGSQGQITLSGVHKQVGHVFTNLRMDADAPASSLFNIFSSENAVDGAGLCNVFIRLAGNSGQPAIRITGDGATADITNLDLQYVSSDGGTYSGDPTKADRSNGRWNVFYNDQGWLHKVAEATMLGCVIPSFNNKTEGFNAPETPPNTAFATGRFYPKGYIVHDGNATAALRVWYQAVADTAVSASGDLANTALWKQIGQQNGIAYGAQPLRTGNWRMRHQVGNVGVVLAGDAQGNTVLGGAADFLPERNSRNGAIALNYTDYYKSPTGAGAIGSLGDYRPKSIASGDAADSPLLNRMPAGRSAMPFDLAGNDRLDDGTGASGPYERAA